MSKNKIIINVSYNMLGVILIWKERSQNELDDSMIYSSNSSSFCVISAKCAVLAN